MNTNQQKVVKYFTNPETKLGFNYVLWGSKHSDSIQREKQISPRKKLKYYIKI